MDTGHIAETGTFSSLSAVAPLTPTCIVAAEDKVEEESPIEYR